jgi:thiol:disulfide interchange protein DsbD
MSFTQRIAESLQGSLASGQLWIALAASFVGGLLTAFTPCVYPLIPITIRYFGGMQKVGRSRVVLRAVVYVLGMVVLYAILGTVFASSGKVFGSFLASRWVLVLIAGFCVAMGLSMLGLFSLQLPTGLNTRLSQVGGQGVGGAFTMGLVSGLIAAPCTGPVLAVILTLIAATGAVSTGFALMVAFGLGLGLPFLGLALFSGALTRVPSGGGWMEVVKVTLATAMFVVAVYFLDIAWPAVGTALGALPGQGVLAAALAAVGVVACVVYLRRLDRPGAVAFKVLTIGVLTVAAGIAVAGRAPVVASTAGGDISWVTSHDRALALGKSGGKPVMIDFGAEWCVACKELERVTYVDPRVRREAQRFVSAKIDATDMTDEVSRLFALYGIPGLPVVVFIDSSGKVLESPRVTGFLPPDELVKVMARVH